MKAEIMREIVMENKAEAFSPLCTITQNALTYMYEQGMSKEEVADYVGCDVNVLDAIDNYDYDIIGRES
jgi:hypothetical protein